MVIVLRGIPLHLHFLKLGLASYIRLKGHPILLEGITLNLTYAVSHLRFWEYQILDFDLGTQNLVSEECNQPPLSGNL